MMINPKPFVQKRLDRLKALMQAKNLDAVIVARPENVFYYSNFNPIINSHPVYVLIDKTGEACLLAHCIRNDHAVTEGAISNVKLYGKWGANVALALDPIDAMAAILGNSVQNLGIEGDFASVNWTRQVTQKLGAENLIDVSKDISMQKIVKDNYEIDCMRKSGVLVDCGVETAIRWLDAGANEAVACTEGQYAMRKLWHEHFSEYEVSGFGSSESAQVDSLVVWCMSNERIAYGCDCPAHYIPQSGDLSLPMAWARIGGYAVENERSVIVGSVDGLKTKAYDAMLRARENVFALIAPGVTFEALYIAAMKPYEEAGFSSILPGRCGHGMGLSTHEFPSLACGNQIKLVPGMIFTVEPGLMTKDWGGVRHSDTILVTENGFERLTQLRNDKIIIKKQLL